MKKTKQAGPKIRPAINLKYLLLPTPPAVYTCSSSIPPGAH